MHVTVSECWYGRICQVSDATIALNSGAGEDCYGAGTDYWARNESNMTNYYKEWGEIITQLKKFQSIVVWVPFNEAWGQFDTKEVVDFTRKWILPVLSMLPRAETGYRVQAISWTHIPTRIRRCVSLTPLRSMYSANMAA